MIVSDAIIKLQNILDKFGDVEVLRINSDCDFGESEEEIEDIDIVYENDKWDIEKHEWVIVVGSPLRANIV
jgi:hypothetical protein